MDLLKRLSEVAGIPGREERVRELIETELAGVVDEFHTDAMGNLHAIKHGKTAAAKKVMIAAHMDEIGFVVKFIDDDGFMRVQPVGGFDARNLFARQVTVHASRSNEDLFGVMNPGGKPIHISTPEERSKVPGMEMFFVDVGLSGDEVKEKVRVGDMITLRQEFMEFGDLATGKALDDRASVWVLMRTLQELKDTPFAVHGVFTTQEEVGLRGAITSSYIVEPDYSVALDVTLALDVPDVPAHQAVSKLGGGVGLKVMDSASISTRWFLDHFIELAEQHDIAHQMEVLPLGGTDAGPMQRARGGSPTVTLSIPTRYIHSVTETIHKQDLNATKEILLAFLHHGL